MPSQDKRARRNGDLGKWLARLKWEGREVYLGTFDTKFEAEDAERAFRLDRQLEQERMPREV